MNFRDRPIAFTDLETSGVEKARVVEGVLRPWHEIIEMGLVLADVKTLEILDTLEVKVKVLHPERFNDGALKVNGWKQENWLNAVSLDEALRRYNEKAVNAVLAAYNVTFDWGFLELAYSLCGLKPTLDYHRIDLFTNALIILNAKGIMLERYNQDAVAQFLGMPPEPLPHLGLQGAMRAYEVYKALLEFSRK